MPPHQLNADALTQIKDLVADPLAETVRAEMDAGYQRLSGAIEGLTSSLKNHVQNTDNIAENNRAKIKDLDERVSALEQMGWKLMGAGVVLTAVLSLMWVATIEVAKYLLHH